MNEHLIKAAKEYLSMGFSVVPVGQDKKPINHWKEFQERLMTEGEAEVLFARRETTGVGIVTGKLSDLFVLDVERGADMSQIPTLPPTLVCLTGGGGKHHYFRYPEGHVIKNSARKIADKMDIRAEGGYAIAPPSLHPSGKRYSWEDPKMLVRASILPAPDWLLDLVKKPLKKQLDSQSLFAGVDEGRRNESAASIAGKLISYLPEKDWENVAWPLTLAWNDRNRPPLQERELRSVFESISERERKSSNHQEPAHDGRLWSIADIMAHEFGEAQWLVQSLIPSRGIVALSGHPGSFKTWLTLEIAKSVAMGTSFLERFATTQGAVLMIDEENQLKHLKQRFSLLGIPREASIHYFSQRGSRLDEPRDVKFLRGVIHEHDIKLVVIDSLIRVHGQDENDARGMARVVRGFQMLTAVGTSILFTHHHRKTGIGPSNPSQNLRGSSDILAAVDSHIAIEQKDGQLIIRQTKLRQAEAIIPFTIEVKKDSGRVSFVHKGEVDEQVEKNKEVTQMVLSLIESEGRSWSRGEIHKHLRNASYGRNAIDQALQTLTETRRVERTADPKNPQQHFYSIPSHRPTP